jgi:two-component system nitrogen regulation sensor histidine kinase GlnL
VPDSRHSIVSQLTTGVITVDAADHILTINPAAEDLLGVSYRSAIGQSLAKLVPGFDPLTTLIQRVRARQQSFGMTLHVLGPQRDGRELELTVRVSPAESSEPGILLVELVDITQRNHLDRESELVNQHGVSRRMLRQLAHEIRNPLSGLRGAAQLLERELNSEQLSEFTQVIISEADRLAELVNALLGPGGAPEFAVGNMHAVLEHVLKIVASGATEIELVRDYDPSLPEVLMDQNQLTQAFLNLVQNAVQVTEGRGKIIVRTRVRGNVLLNQKIQRMVACIEIEDDGPGVPNDIAETIFYPLVTGRVNGTGLGLPLAQDLVNRHNGLIEYESVPGLTVFSVLLPIAKDGK